jgi:hypothetical protein
MSTLELSTAADYYFGDKLFSTSHFTNWLNAKGLTLPVDLRIQGYMFLQVYALLSEIQSYAFSHLPVEKACAMVQKDIELSKCQYKPAARLQISFKVRDQWRSLLIETVAAGELTLFDYASKLPVAVPSAVPVTDEEDSQAEPQAGNGHEWKEKAWTMAEDIHKNNSAKGWGTDKKSVAKEIEKMFGPDQLNLTTKTGKSIGYEYIVRHALGGWNERFG